VEYQGEGIRIMGRSSIDILKVGGFKVSALEVENLISDRLPEIQECAIVGKFDEIYGQKIVLYYVSNATIDAQQIENSLKFLLKSYQMPREFHKIDSLPRNAMGKVNKPQLRSTC
jgi:malonyl-CoA/methylmalonyl-CoA synthetase